MGLAGFIFVMWCCIAVLLGFCCSCWVSGWGSLMWIRGRLLETGEQSEAQSRGLMDDVEDWFCKRFSA